MSKSSLKKLSKQVKKLKSKITRHYRENPTDLLNHKQLTARIGLKDAQEKQILFSVIEAMTKEGLLKEEHRGKFRWSGPINELEGIISFNRAGTAFVEIAGFDRDIMIPEHQTSNALHGDCVAIRLMTGGGGGRPKGKVIDIIERARTSFPAVIFSHGDRSFALPDNQKISVDFYIPKDKLLGASDGDKVVVHLVQWDNVKLSPEAEVTDVLGRAGDMRAEGDAILAEFGFPLKFPDAVERECAALDLKINEKEVANRRDFRDVLTFTIDPADAKDFDDALSFQKLENGHFEIGVHIADVTHYVKEGSELEKEAQNRATSVYLVDRVIPMLPEVLSNQACSLRPNEDKYTFSAVFEIDAKANIHNTWIGKTAIHSDHRFTYEDAQEVLETKSGPHEEALTKINTLAKIIRAKRMENGAIAFEKSEVKFQLDEDRKPVDVWFKVQKDAHKLIEEFMLLANKAVAKKVGDAGADQKGKSFVYRIHDRPDPIKLQDFAEFVKRFGYAIDLNTPKNIATSINKMLTEVKGKPEQNMLEMLAIRSMSKAEYSSQNIGHFGLAFPFYSHFTSPIRRYPDMMAHRLLFSYLNGAPSAPLDPIDRLCKHSSIMERKASEAERESTRLYQVIYMSAFEGDVFDGVISGVTEWGVFVEIVSNKCEGLVRLRDIDGDFYYFDQPSMSVIGQRTKTTIQLGEKVSVKVMKADLENRRIDLKIV